MTSTEAAFSDLINKPKATLQPLTGSVSHSIRLRRRDDVDLVITTADRYEQEHEVIGMTVRFFGALVLHRGAESTLALLTDVFPWVTFMTEPDQRTLLDEFVLTLRAALDLDNFAPVAQLITEWKHTAEVYADPRCWPCSPVRPTTSAPFRRLGPHDAETRRTSRLTARARRIRPSLRHQRGGQELDRSLRAGARQCARGLASAPGGSGAEGTHDKTPPVEGAAVHRTYRDWLSAVAIRSDRGRADLVSRGRRAQPRVSDVRRHRTREGDGVNP